MAIPNLGYSNVIISGLVTQLYLAQGNLSNEYIKYREMDNTEKLKFLRRVRDISSKVLNESLDAPILTLTIVSIWSRRLCPDLDLKGLQYSKEVAKHPLIIAFVEWLANKALLESAYWISSAYSLWVADERRKSLAMFFTPPPLTDRLLDDLEDAGISFAKCSFFDPACGGAAFLAPIAARMKKALYANRKSPTEILKHVENHLYGTDLDETLCVMSRHFLKMVLYDEIRLTNYELNLRIANSNSLNSIREMYGTIDVVVSNPPYRKMTPDEVKIYRDEYDDVIEAQPNLYGLFISLCVKLLRHGGTAALVTPTSYMSGQYFSKLRCWLMESAEILHIGVISERSGVFIFVEQETALTIVRRKSTSNQNQPSAKIAVVSKSGQYTSVGRCTLPNSGRTWPIARLESDIALIQLADKSKFRLPDYGYVTRVGAFVWNRDMRSTYFSLEEAIAKGATLPVPLLWSSDICQGALVRFSELPKSNGEPAFVDIVNPSHRSLVKKPAVLLQRVTSNDQARRLVAAIVPNSIQKRYSGFISENHTVILEAQTEDPEVPTEILVKLLGSGPIDRYFRCISGANNVSAFELAQLPLPCPKRLMKVLERESNFDAAVRLAFQN